MQLNPCLKGKHIGLLTDAGCPNIADPGSKLIMHAHENQIKVIPLVGPSSILLAMMASGLNGNNFSFNGYLPIEEKKRIKKIKEFEINSKKK
jgi:16S rRNA (cytidine1402-2'-O)-methyltransferase